jgi:hypothetical protein
LCQAEPNRPPKCASIALHGWHGSCSTRSLRGAREVQMLSTQSWTMIRYALLLAAGACWVPACGGTAEFTRGGSAGQAAAGANNAGANSAGANSAGTSSGGAGNSGAGGGCAAVACPAIACGPGYEMVRQAGSCCGTCVPDGSGGSGGRHVCDGACTQVACGPGYKSVVQPGACCPTCVPDGTGGRGASDGCDVANCPAIDCAQGYRYQHLTDQCCGTCVPDPEACTTAQMAYRALRSSLLADSSVFSCSKATDCQLLAGNGDCGDFCPADYVNAAAAATIGEQLTQFAVNNCSSCPQIPIPACEAPAPVACIDGMCGIAQ